MYVYIYIYRVAVNVRKLSVELLFCSDSCAVVSFDWEDSSSRLSTQLATADASSSWCCTSEWHTLPTEGAADVVFCGKVTGFSMFTRWSQNVWRCKHSVFASRSPRVILFWVVSICVFVCLDICRHDNWTVGDIITKFSVHHPVVKMAVKFH